MHNLLHNGDDVSSILHSHTALFLLFIKIEVTEDNRADYVNRYTDWLLNKCIKVLNEQ